MHKSKTKLLHYRVFTYKSPKRKITENHPEKKIIRTTQSNNQKVKGKAKQSKAKPEDLDYRDTTLKALALSLNYHKTRRAADYIHTW